MNLSETINSYVKSLTFEVTKETLPSVLRNFFSEAEKRKAEFMRVNHHCAICDKRLSPLEISRTGPTNYNYVCNAHIDSINVFQTSIIRQKAGFPAFQEPTKFYE